MSVPNNLNYSSKAVAEVNRLLPLGSETRQKFLGQPVNPTTRKCMVSQEEMQQSCIERGKMFAPRTRQNSVVIDCAARMARTYGCGNCGENAALAFTLLKQWNVQPVDLMKCTNMDHLFVVIGMRAGANSGDYKTWGPDAVVCDPWAPGRLKGLKGRYYAANRIKTEMVGGATTRYTSMQRWPARA